MVGDVPVECLVLATGGGSADVTTRVGHARKFSPLGREKRLVDMLQPVAEHARRRGGRLQVVELALEPAHALRRRVELGLRRGCVAVRAAKRLEEGRELRLGSLTARCSGAYLYSDKVLLDLALRRAVGSAEEFVRGLEGS